MAFSRHGKEVKRTRFFTPAVCEFFAIVSSLSLFSRLCILAVGEDRFPSGWRPGSEWNKGWRELLVFDLRKGRRGKAYFLRERSEQEM